MNIKEMHYGFKLGYNKLDSNQNRNLLIPEVDFLLNTALSMYVNNIFFPRDVRIPGFENSQRSIDNIRTLVVPGKPVTVSNKIAAFPTDYWHFVAGYAEGKRGTCTKNLRMFFQQQDDLFEENSVYKSDFDWETLNFIFTSRGLELKYSGFEVPTLYLSYVKKHDYIHNAEDYDPAGYVNFQNTLLTGHQNCELPDDSCKDIVDIAIFLASGAVQDSAYTQHKEKLTFNQTM